MGEYLPNPALLRATDPFVEHDRVEETSIQFVQGGAFGSISELIKYRREVAPQNDFWQVDDCQGDLLQGQNISLANLSELACRKSDSDQSGQGHKYAAALLDIVASQMATQIPVHRAGLTFWLETPRVSGYPEIKTLHDCY